MMRKILVALSTFACLASRGQAPIPHGSADIYRELKKLRVLGSVLYMAAHPDDENTRLLAWLSSEKNYRTGYLSLTRGDGGQNLIGDEQGIELGLIRTQELLAARRIDGAEQFFSTAYDFGFSKNASEALRIWGHEKILSDAVWIIRRFQPDVIITRFPPDERAGHGHHAASAVLAAEAFKAAADTKMFPEQLRFVKPWQAKRLLWNTFNFGGTNTTSNDQFRLETGDFNTLIGEGYGEIAAESRSQHKSQGFGVAKARGQSTEYFSLTAGDAPSATLMDGVDTSWLRVRGTAGEEVGPMIDRIIAKYDFEHPDRSVDSLVSLYRLIHDRIEEGEWRREKLRALSSILLQCAGVFAEATSQNMFAVQGTKLPVQLFVNKTGSFSVTWKSVSLEGLDSTLDRELPTNRPVILATSVSTPAAILSTQPYWLRETMDTGHFTVSDQALIGLPEDRAPLEAIMAFNIGGKLTLYQRCPVRYKHTDPVKAELYEPLPVVPPVSVSIAPAVVLTDVSPVSGQQVRPSVTVRVHSNIKAAAVPVKLQLLENDRVLASKDSVIDIEPGYSWSWDASVTKDMLKVPNGRLKVSAALTLGGKTATYQNYVRHIAYDHIPDIWYFYRDQVTVVRNDVRTAGKRIGYIPGAGDHIPDALRQMGYQVTILNGSTINDENLANLDAVVTGVRAYNVHEYLSESYSPLMRFVQNGGNLIVQYNTNNQIGPVRAKIFAYPFNISRTRVTEENANVSFLLPQHPVLNYPNKITQKDFESWIQERSTYQAEQLDPHFEAPLSMHDTNEPASNGSLVIAPYGKGNLVYCGLVLFRELPAGVPGAYRLFANMIGLPKHETK